MTIQDGGAPPRPLPVALDEIDPDDIDCGDPVPLAGEDGVLDEDFDAPEWGRGMTARSSEFMGNGNYWCSIRKNRRE